MQSPRHDLFAASAKCAPYQSCCCCFFIVLKQNKDKSDAATRFGWLLHCSTVHNETTNSLLLIIIICSKQTKRIDFAFRTSPLMHNQRICSPFTAIYMYMSTCLYVWYVYSSSSLFDLEAGGNWMHFLC